MPSVRPLYIPPASTDGAGGSLILRDGTSASIRPARPGDEAALHAFVDRLSPRSRAHRFLSESPLERQVASLCATTDPRHGLTLVVHRQWKGALRIVAVGSYLAREPMTAEVALAVDEDFQDQGLGPLLLERLALLAVQQGFVTLRAACTDDAVVREMFQEAGFEVRERPGDGAAPDVTAELTLARSEASAARSELRERLAAAASLRAFFLPRSIAVVGASRDPASIGHRILTVIQGAGFRGRLYPVNPHARELAGLPVAPSVSALPEAPDLAVIVVPRDVVLPVVEECARRGGRALLVITAGFAESGQEGRRLQDRLVEVVRQHGMRMIGPNCFGLVNTDPRVRLNATFTSTFPPVGRVAMSSQSGALGLALLAAARRLQLGISTFVSVGNKADVSGNDLLQYWEEDPQTEVILLYLESFGNPRRFARLARRVSRRKPIVAVKAGRSQAGRRAAGSHTAALAAREVAVEALFRQTGVIRAETLDEMIALANLLSNQPLPSGRRVGLVTNAGGPAILCTDACVAGGLDVPELTEVTRERLAAFLPPNAALRNPVDLIASATPEQYRRTIETILTSGDVDALVVLYVSVELSDTDAIARGILDGIEAGRSRGAKHLPVLACWMAASDPERVLTRNGEHVPTYPMPEMPARVLSKAAAYADWRRTPPGLLPDFEDMQLAAAGDLCRRVLAERGADWLTAEETRTLLAAARLPLLSGEVARSPEEAVAVAQRVGFPVAVKLVSRRLVHKTEVGGVHLGVQDASAVRSAFEAIRRAALAHEPGREEAGSVFEGVLVQPMVQGGVELIVGVTQDPLFGPLVAFGLGGIHVEVLGDVRFRVTPLTDRDAEEMLRDIKGFRLLEGYRGHPPGDLPAIRELLLRVSRLVEALPQITELDLNPVFALAPGEGCRIVDARVRVA